MLDQTAQAQWVGATLGEYRLTRMLGTTPMGPIFTADSAASNTTFLVRVLNVPPAQTPEMMERYRAQMERQAGHIATLRHPYILPLVNYGISQGLPYLVWPYASMRSLSTRLSQSGVLDVVTAGRYLDQIAAALEYAHEHSTFHRNLSLDSIYLQLDGQIVVGDFGARRLYELLAPNAPMGGFFGSLEALAPEQITGGQIGSYTDVYALGGVAFHLLTGRSVFSGETLNAVIEQHLHAQPTPISRVRSGLPPALDTVLVGALAKDPAVRTRYPGAFADAYNQIIDPANTRRVPFDTPGNAYNGHSPVPQSTPSQPAPGRVTGSVVSSPVRGRPTPGLAGSLPPAGGSWTPTGSRSFLSRSWWFFALLIVLIPLISIGAFYLANRGSTPVATGTASGTVRFADSSAAPTGSTNKLQIAIDGLAPPASGSTYQGWLIDQKTEHITPLGLLTHGTKQSYSLTFAATSATHGTSANLLALGDMIEITAEHGSVAAPTGHVALAIKFPPDAFTHIKHLLLSYPTTPGAIGLLVGTLRQAQLLNTQAKAISQAVGNRDSFYIQCLAQSIIDIDEGKQGAHYQPLSAGCIAAGVTQMGDGFGLLTSASSAYDSDADGYIKNAADHASLATATPDVTPAIKQYASKVVVALDGVTQAVTTVDTNALALLQSPNNVALASALATANTAAYQGTGAPGAGGAVAAYQLGQQMATLTLAAPTK